MTLQACRFQVNKTGLQASNGAVCTITDSTFTGNVDYAVRCDADSSVNASGCWWGAADGPSEAGSGSGDKVGQNVVFSNWLQDPIHVTLPGIPGSSALECKANEVLLTWAKPNNSGGGIIEQYRIYRKKSGDQFSFYDNVEDQTRYSDSDFTIDTMYTYKVSAVNSAGEGPMSIAIVTDQDDDGLPDSWELFYFKNFSRNGGMDSDDDQLENADELQYGTHPGKKDTDGDTVNDNLEIARGTDPCDPHIPGDLNQDKTVDLQDAVLANQYMNDPDAPIEVDVKADVNGDEKIGIVEAIYILNQRRSK